MLTTKRYEYLETTRIQIHPSISNHRPLNEPKVLHLEEDIVHNGLLEPLVVWERAAGEYFMVGGFHRYEAIKRIRNKNPGYFDRVDVRVVAGDPDEIKALNLKLNSDRLDVRITDYFETVLFLNNVNWSKNRIADFLDKSESWIEEILRYAPMVTPEMRAKLESGEISWNRAKEIVQKSVKAPAGKEKETINEELSQNRPRSKPLTFRSAITRLARVMKANPKRTVTVSVEDIYSLILTLQGKHFEKRHLDRVRHAFPDLMEE
jgi:ParB family transcriptional regulator, chromosome partitioning protein